MKERIRTSILVILSAVALITTVCCIYSAEYIGGLACAVVPAYFFSYNSCSSKAAVLNTDYRFGFYEGCFIKEDGKWVDYDRYRIINQE